MTKTHSASTSEGTLYGIRFNQKTGVSHWVTPYAWLNQGDDWYLVKYLTPNFFVKWFPWLMNRVGHEAWKVDKKEIFDNPEFQIPDDEATLKQPEDKMGASKYTIGIVGGPIFAGLLYKIVGFFLPSDNQLSILSSIIILIASFLFFSFLIIAITIVLNKLFGPLVDFHIPTKPNFDYLITKNSINLLMKVSVWRNKLLAVYIVKLCLLIFGLIPWSIYLMAIFKWHIEDSSAQLALNGLVLSIFTLLFIFPLFFVLVFPFRGNSTSVIIKKIDEENK